MAILLITMTIWVALSSMMTPHASGDIINSLYFRCFMGDSRLFHARGKASSCFQWLDRMRLALADIGTMSGGDIEAAYYIIACNKCAILTFWCLGQVDDAMGAIFMSSILSAKYYILPRGLYRALIPSPTASHFRIIADHCQSIGRFSYLINNEAAGTVCGNIGRYVISICK